MRGCFVTGTDTGVGKTVVSAAIVAALRASGHPVRALKPVITGLDEPTGQWPHDHALLARVAGSTPDDVAISSYGPAVSPHLAQQLTGAPLDPDHLRAAVRSGGGNGRALIVEGVGGLLVPLCDGYDVRQLAADAGLPLVIVARPGLGTINHTLLTLEAARRAGLPVSGVVLNPWPSSPAVLEQSNRETIEELGQVPVATLPHVEEVTTEALAAAGRRLPIETWLA